MLVLTLQLALVVFFYHQLKAVLYSSLSATGGGSVSSGCPLATSVCVGGPHTNSGNTSTSVCVCVCPVLAEAERVG